MSPNRPEDPEKFQVSEMTVRRDIRKLAALGQVIRVPGGARIERPFGGEKSFFERFQRMGDAKQSIGKAAARLVAEGESVTLGSGTTSGKAACTASHNHPTQLA